MYRFVGENSGKIYAEGTKEDCFKKLNDKYPFIPTRNGVLGHVYQEPLLIMKIGGR